MSLWAIFKNLVHINVNGCGMIVWAFSLLALLKFVVIACCVEKKKQKQILKRDVFFSNLATICPKFSDVIVPLMKENYMIGSRHHLFNSPVCSQWCLKVLMGKNDNHLNLLTRTCIKLHTQVSEISISLRDFGTKPFVYKLISLHDRHNYCK